MELCENISVEKRLSLHQFLQQKANLADFNIVPIDNDCSTRVYYRVVAGNNSKILMDSSKEAKSFNDFIIIGDWLRSQGLNAPEIFTTDAKKGLMLIEDFGKFNLNLYLNQWPNKEYTVYQKAIDILVKLHDASINIKLENQSADVLNMGLMRLFVGNYLPAIIQGSNLEKAIDELFSIFNDLYKVIALTKQVVVLRDYHAENLMVINDYNDLGIIDFQDAMIGCHAYDLLSLLEDARRDVNSQLSARCIAYYASQVDIGNKDVFDEAYAVLSAQRNLRIIGLFHKLFYQEGRDKYALCIPRVVGYLKNTLKHPRLVKLADWIQTYNVIDNNVLRY